MLVIANTKLLRLLSQKSFMWTSVKEMNMKAIFTINDPNNPKKYQFKLIFISLGSFSYQGSTVVREPV